MPLLLNNGWGRVYECFFFFSLLGVFLTRSFKLPSILWLSWERGLCLYMPMVIGVSYCFNPRVASAFEKQRQTVADGSKRPPHSSTHERIRAKLDLLNEIPLCISMHVFSMQ